MTTSITGETQTEREAKEKNSPIKERMLMTVAVMINQGTEEGDHLRIHVIATRNIGKIEEAQQREVLPGQMRRMLMKKRIGGVATAAQATVAGAEVHASASGHQIVRGATDGSTAVVTVVAVAVDRVKSVESLEDLTVGVRVDVAAAAAALEGGKKATLLQLVSQCLST